VLSAAACAFRSEPILVQWPANAVNLGCPEHGAFPQPITPEGVCVHFFHKYQLSSQLGHLTIVIAAHRARQTNDLRATGLPDPVVQESRTCKELLT
jgi:hypothetical protein